MGVYIFQSKINKLYCKIGCYKGSNVWCRIAHRGFYSCNRPEDIKDNVSVDDLELIAWFPHLNSYHESLAKSHFRSSRIIGEWFNSTEIPNIIKYLSRYDLSDFINCSKEQALLSRRRI